MSAGEYIASLGFRLTVAEAMAALPEGSNPQIAAVAGVDQSTVYRTRQRFADANPDDAPPARVIGADGKSYPGRVVREVHDERHDVTLGTGYEGQRDKRVTGLTSPLVCGR